MKTKSEEAQRIYEEEQRRLEGWNRQGWEYKVFSLARRAGIPRKPTQQFGFWNAHAGFVFARWAVEEAGKKGKSNNLQLKAFPEVLAKENLSQRLQLLDGFAYGIQCYVESRRQGAGKGCSDRTPVIKAISDGMREVGELKSVRELHEWLRRKLGSNAAGSLKRVEKIAQDLGIRFRPPGRPRKIQKPTR